MNKVNRQRIAGRFINMHIAALLLREDKGNPWIVRKFDQKVQEKAHKSPKVKKIKSILFVFKSSVSDKYDGL